jgi:hypothetical protein
MVTDVPDYPTPPLEQVDEQCAAELRRQEERAEASRVREEVLAQYAAAAQDKVKAATANEATLETATVGTAHVGTAAPGCPGGPEVPARSAVPRKPVQAEAATRKPPVSVKEALTSTSTEVPKERKSAAHRASGGKGQR